MNLQDWPTTAWKWTAMFLAAMWATMPKTLPALLLFMAIDFVTGMMAAFVRQEIHSGKSLRGLVKKTLIILLVITVHEASKLLGAEIGFTYDLGSLVAIAYIVNEIISIAENCARAGVPVPQVLMDALDKAKGTEWTPEYPDRRTQGNPEQYRGRERRKNP